MVPSFLGNATFFVSAERPVDLIFLSAARMSHIPVAFLAPESTLQRRQFLNRPCIWALYQATLSTSAQNHNRIEAHQ